MRGLGRPFAAAGTRWACGTAIAALALLLTGCSGDDPSGSGDPSPSGASESTSPSADPTPSVLEGGTRLEGPAFTITIPPGYELIDQDDGGEFGSWTRGYSLPINVLTKVRIRYTATDRVLPLDEKLEVARGYLESRAARKIRRVEDSTLVGHPTAHLVGRDGNARFHVYIVDLGDRYLEIALERAADDTEQERAQQAMLDSIRLPG